MTTRAMNASAGFEWLKKAVNLGRNNPKAVFGGVALLLVVTIAVALAMSLVQGMLVAAIGSSIGVLLGSSVLMGLVLVVVLAGLMVGFMRLVDAVENGRDASAMDVFGGFSGGVALRAIGFLLLVALVQYLLMAAVLMLVAGDVIAWYMEMMQAAAAGTAPTQMGGLPGGFGLAVLAMTVIGLLVYAVQAIGLCQIALRDRGVFAAFADGLGGAVKNLLPLLVLLLSLIVFGIVIAIVVGLLALLLGVLAKLVGTWLLVVLAIPLYLAAMVVAYVIGFGLMYYLWRDVCDGGSAASADGQAVVA